MKGINKFFYRLDQLKKLYFWISIPIALLCWFYPVGVVGMMVWTPISHLGLIVGLVPLRMPTDEEIVKATLDSHKAHRAHVARGAGVEEEALDMLEGFSNERAYLRRRIGSQTVYPVCRSLVFHRADGVLMLMVKDTPLMQGLSPAENSYTLSPDAPACVSLSPAGKGLTRLSLTLGGETQIAYVRDKYKIKDVLAKYRPYLQIETAE